MYPQSMSLEREYFIATINNECLKDLSINGHKVLIFL